MSLARASRPHRGRRTRARAMHRVATPAREDVTRAEKYLYFFRDQRPQDLVSNPANRYCTGRNLGVHTDIAFCLAEGSNGFQPSQLSS